VGQGPILERFTLQWSPLCLSVDVHSLYGDTPTPPVNQLPLPPALQAMAGVQVTSHGGYSNIPSHPVPLMGITFGVNGNLAGQGGGYSQSTTVVTPSLTTSSKLEQLLLLPASML